MVPAPLAHVKPPHVQLATGMRTHGPAARGAGIRRAPGPSPRAGQCAHRIFLSRMNTPTRPDSAPPLHPASVAAIRARERAFTWGVRLAVAGAAMSVVGSLMTAHAAGWPLTLAGTAVVALGLVLALTRLPSQAFYNGLPGALDDKERHRCVACGDRGIARPRATSRALWNRPRCLCARCGQFLFVE
jgi:hypothetical protein